MSSADNQQRIYPSLPTHKGLTYQNISFVVVRFSDEIIHNFYCSECIYNAANEVIEVDNTANLFFDNLTQAIMEGVKKAKYDIIAIVHEDVLLPPGWQQSFESALTTLEKKDPDWGLLGSIGWATDGKMVGNCSDPHSYHYHLDDNQSYGEVERLDEQLLIIHHSRLPKFDPNLPGIHHIGRDLAFHLKELGLHTYAIDAPTIHKYADDAGTLVLSKAKSKKIMDRRSLTYLADEACCHNYITSKWPALTLQGYVPSPLSFNNIDDHKHTQLDSPIILISRGGSGSRLLSTMAQDMDIFLGNKVNLSGDAMELVQPIYQGIVEKYRCKTVWQKKQITPRIKAACTEMIKDIPLNQLWGFKLPECIFLLPELQEAFPNARYIHFLRDPLSTCLRRTHMTARLDNHIGRITLPLAYDYLKIDRKNILNDHSVKHMVNTTIHQLNLIKNNFDQLPRHKKLEIKLENIIEDPGIEMNILCKWIGQPIIHHTLEGKIDKDRATIQFENYSQKLIESVKSSLKYTRKDFNYIL